MGLSLGLLGFSGVGGVSGFSGSSGFSLKVEAGKTATLKVSDIPKVTDTLIELFKIDMETQKGNPQGNASLAGAEFTWKYYAGFYNKDNR